MILESTVAAVTPLAEALTESGISLSITSNSRLRDLAGHLDGARVNQDLYIQNVGVRTPAFETTRNAHGAGRDIIKESMKKDISGNSAHDELSEHLINETIVKVRDNLKLARSVVNPLIRVTLEEVEKLIQQINIEATNVIRVESVFADPIWNSSQLAAMASKFSETPFINIKIQHVFPPRSVQDIIAMMKTGTVAMDTMIDKWANSLKGSFITEAYENIFSGGSNSVNVIYLNDAIRWGKDSSLIAFLIARAANKEIPEGIDMGAESFRAYISGIEAQAGAIVCREIDKLDEDIKNGVLVIEYPYISDNRSLDGGVIFVNGSVYNGWLDKGGTPEVLMGALASGDHRQSSRRGEDILLKKDQYLDAWNRYAGILRSKQLSRSFTTAITAISKIVSSQIVGMSEDNLSGIGKDVMQKRLEEILSKATMYDVENLHRFIQKVICQSMFPLSDAEEILTEIDVAFASNPGLDIRQAATVAIIAVVSRWAIGNLSYTKSSSLK